MCAERRIQAIPVWGCWDLPVTRQEAAPRGAIYFQWSAGAFEGRGQDAVD